MTPTKPHHLTVMKPTNLKRSTSQPRQQEPKVALVVGRHGIGEKIAKELAKTMSVVITYVSDSGGSRALKTTHHILGVNQVPDHVQVHTMKFNPDDWNGANTLVTQVIDKLGRLDVVVFASIYDSLTAKSEIFHTEVSAFYAIYQAAMTVRKDGFRIIHVSDHVSKVRDDVHAAIEALVRILGEQLLAASTNATVNAVRKDSKKDTDDDVVTMVARLAKVTSWYINGQIIRRSSI